MTDERGRFRAEVLPNRPYSVWAVQSQGDTYRHSNIVENVFANVPVILEEAGDPRPRKRLRVQGLDAWKDWAPLRTQVVGNTANTLILHLDLDQAGEALLPPIAGDVCTAEVYTDSGQLLWKQSVSLAESGDPAPELSLPPPFPILVAVRDKSGTQPLVGARILQRVRQGWAPVATTGPDGIAVLSLALERANNGVAIWRNRVLLAEADGYCPGAPITVKMDLTADKDVAVLRARGDVDAYAGLEPAPMLKGRLLLAPGNPAAETDLILYGRYASFRNGSSIAGPLVQFLRTDAEGNFAVPSPQTSSGFRLCAVLGEAQLARLFPGGAPMPHPLVLLAHDGQRVPDRGMLGDLRIDRLCPLDIAVTHDDRTPAPHAILGYAEFTEQNSQDLTPCGFVTDRHGRQRILVPTTNQLLLGAMHNGTGQILSTELTVHAGIEVPIALGLVLTRPSTIRGRVLSSAGVPLTDASITCFPVYRNRLSNHATQSTVQPTPADQNSVRILAVDQWQTNWALSSHLLQDMSADSDDKGNFSLFVPTASLQYYVRATFLHNGTEYKSSTIAVRFIDRESQEVDLTIDLR